MGGAFAAVWRWIISRLNVIIGLATLLVAILTYRIVRSQAEISPDLEVRLRHERETKVLGEWEELFVHSPEDKIQVEIANVGTAVARDIHGWLVLEGEGYRFADPQASRDALIQLAATAVSSDSGSGTIIDGNEAQIYANKLVPDSAEAFDLVVKPSESGGALLTLHFVGDDGINENGEVRLIHRGDGQNGEASVG